MDINSVNITGRLTKDPEVKTTSTGKTVAQLSVAVGGYKRDEVHYVDVIWWPAKPEHVGFFHKGNRVAVSGALKQERWTDQGGQSQQRLKVNAQSVVSMEKAPAQEQGRQNAGFGAPAPQQQNAGFGSQAQQPAPSAQYYQGTGNTPPKPNHFSDEDIPF